MKYSLNFGNAAWRTPASDAWGPAAALLATRLRKSLWLLALCAVGGAGLGGGVKYVLPPSYTSTTQLLFDPRGFRIFSDELTTGNYDANAAINYVESQMAVLQSERVYSRVIKSECAVAETGAPAANFVKYCAREGWKGDMPRALQELERSVVLHRTERSFVVDIFTTAKNPDVAARLGKTLVDAYNAEDAVTRVDAANRLTSDLSGRLDGLREKLKASESKAEGYRRDKDLLKVGDKLLVEQKLATATTALADTQTKLDRAEARAKQIETSGRDPGAIAALGADPDARALQALLDRREQMRIEIAPLAARVGDRHPLLVEARGKLSQIDRGIAQQVAAMRRAAQSDVSRTRREYANLSETVTNLTAKVSKARQSEIELRAIEQDVEANRKLLETFEARSRQAGEYGKIDAANLRIVSVPLPPGKPSRLPKVALWSVLGLIAGLVLATGVVALLALLSQRKPPASGESDSGTHGYEEALETLKTQAQALAKYRYG
ncbi:MAG: GumC family protein [Hyphomicrobiales bacterium]|nr:GumC family protein [Hyphomicrobiales bacterium]